VSRRRKPPAAARLRPFWLLTLALIVALGAAAYAAVMLPVFLPRTIAAKGNHVVAASDVVARAAIDPRRNMWLQDSVAIEKRVEVIPYVATVHLERAWPDVETVVVTERVPYATITAAGTTLVVDHDLRVLAASLDAPALPAFGALLSSPVEPGAFLVDASVKALRDDLDALVDAHLTVRSLGHDKYGDLVVTLRNGVRVLFGDEEDLAKKIPLVNPILSQVGRAGRPISAIDLRAPGTPVVVYQK
jgi:cell division septal protein FtsQ